jgi:hypothetical protein
MSSANGCRVDFKDFGYLHGEITGGEHLVGCGALLSFSLGPRPFSFPLRQAISKPASVRCAQTDERLINNPANFLAVSDILTLANINTNQWHSISFLTLQILAYTSNYNIVCTCW